MKGGADACAVRWAPLVHSAQLALNACDTTVERVQKPPHRFRALAERALIEPAQRATSRRTTKAACGEACAFDIGRMVARTAHLERRSLVRGVHKVEPRNVHAAPKVARDGRLDLGEVGLEARQGAQRR